MKTYLFLLSFLLNLIVSKQVVAVSVPSQLVGNWFEQKGDGYWTYSFFPQFVVTDHSFWQIEGIYRHQHLLQIKLKQGSQKKDILIKLITDSLVEINGKKYIQNEVGIKRKAITTYVNQGQGNALIKGYIHNFQFRYDTVDRVVFTVNDFVLGTQKTYFAPIDSVSGQFSVSLELNGPQDIYMSYYPSNHFPRIFVAPGDTLVMYIDSKTFGQDKDGTQFMGRHADVCYDLYEMENPYKKSLPSLQEYNNALKGEPEEYYSFRIKVKEKALDFLEAYCSKRECAPLFIDWFKINAEIEMYKELLNFSWQSLSYGPGSSKPFSKEKKKAYYDLFTDSIQINNHFYTVSSQYPWLLNPLSQVKIDFSDEKIFENEFTQLLKLLYSHKKELTQELLLYLNKISQTYTSEKQIPEQEKQLWWDLIDKYDEQIKVTKTRAYFDWLLAQIEKIDNEHLQDLFLCLYYHHWALEEANSALLEYGFEKITKRIKNSQYLEKIRGEYMLVKAQQESVIPIISPTEATGKAGDILLEELREKHRGKALLIDFWATWCGPCLSDFKQMKQIKQKLMGKDIVFIYLCSESPKQTWQQMLKKYDLKGEHYLLTTKEYYDLKQKFNINGFPSYLLISKKGKISKEIPRPSDLNSLVQTLTKAIEN